MPEWRYLVRNLRGDQSKIPPNTHFLGRRGTISRERGATTRSSFFNFNFFYFG